MLHQIGVGALGPVFRTYEPGRDRLVAVKVFRLDITPEQSRALADELARAADAGLFHPSIVEPLAAGVEGTVAYRAEEYVAAESLDIALRHYAPAAPEKVLAIVTQLGGAIDFARAVGIGHGALHPRDIFVTPDEARVTGFGVVDALERVGIRAPVRRPYSAPERIAGVTWGTAADVFSLAAMAYELLTGRRPAGTGEQIGPVAGFEQAQAVRAVIARAMDDDPARRHGDALAFASALEASISAAEHAEARSAAPPERAAPIPVRPRAAGSEKPEPGRPPAEEPPPGVKEPVRMAAPQPGPEKTAAPATEVEHSADAPIEPGPPPVLRQDRDATPDSRESPADRLAVRAAELSLSEATIDRFADEFTEPPQKEPDSKGGAKEAVSPPPRTSPAPPNRSTIFRDEAFDSGRYARTSDQRSSQERAHPVMLPVAVAAIAFLLLGYTAGYLVGSRGSGESIGGQESAGAASEADDLPRPTQETEQAVPSPTALPDSPPVVPPEAPGSAASDPAPEQPTKAPTGRLVIRSNPAGAGVTVNGEWRGRTPLTLDDLAMGTYAVRVVQPGFEVASEELTLSSATTARTMNVRLQRRAAAAKPAPQRRAAPAPPPTSGRSSSPASFNGSVYVDSRPRGAKVFINGKEVGTTPLRVPEIGIGSHVVRLELPDHRIWTASVRVAAGEETRVSGSLDPIR